MATSHPANILLVDDSPANLKALVATLEPLGYNLITALSGEEALKYLLQQEFAVVLLDVQMPKMDGFETAKLIHSRPTTQDLPIIFLTAIYHNVSYACLGYSAGAVDYLLKPLVPAILLAKVKVFVELFQKTAIVKQQAKLLAATNSQLEVEIKQRQIALEKLRKSEAALVAAQRIAHLGNWELDVVNQKFRWSEELFRIFGFDGESEPTYTEYFNYIHPDDRPALQTQFERAITAKIPFNLEYRIVRANHSIRYLESKSEVVVNSQGQTIQLLGTILDITERKQAELEITKSRDLREAIFNESADALFLVDSQTLLPTDCNQRALELFQAASKSELIGIDYHNLSQQLLNFDELAAAVDEISQPKIWSQEIEFITQQGNKFWGNIAVKKIQIAEQIMHLVRITDISKQKLTEKSLQRYERMVATTTDGMVLINRNYIYEIANQAYLTLRHKSHTEVIGHSVSEVLGQEWFEQFVKARFQECLTGKTTNYECWWNYPDKESQFLSVTYAPYVEPDQTISGVVVSIRDLTTLQRTEAAWRESEARFQAFMDNSPALAWITDTTGRVLFLSQSYLHKFKLLVEEPIGKSIFDLYPSEIAQHFLNNIQKVAETDQVIEAIEVAPRINDTFGIFLVYEFPIPGVSTQKLVGGVALDITDRKRIEDALRESEEKFRQLAENIQAVFWITDIHNQQILYVSKAYETIWQRSCESLHQNAAAWLDAVHPEDRSRVELELLEQAKTGQCDKRYRIIRPNGSIRWIRDRAFPIKNELGEMVRIAGIAEDITDQQKVEQMKSEFIGIVSHELRTPLTSIRAAMGLLNSGVYEQKPDKSKRIIEIAAIDCERLVRLVNDILDLERLESGRAILEKTTCNATDLIQQAVAGVQAIAEQQNITFDIYTAEAQVWAANDAIIQTLINLLGNAIKFSPANATITLSVQPQTDCVLFGISDQGPGIPAEKLEAIFGRFQQVDASDSRAKGGTGLGLAICRSIIEQHGGQIWAESTVSVGSTFFFTLPKNKEQRTKKSN